MNTRSLSRVMARNIFSADAAEVLPPREPTPGRYEARVSDKGWLVWDQRIEEPVVSFEGQFDQAAAERAAERLNRGHARAVRR